MSLASPVFKKLFLPGFRESNELESNGEADILHHRAPEEARLTTRQLVTIAIQGDNLTTAEEHGLILLAIHYLRLADIFSIYSAKAQIRLAPTFYDEEANFESLASMPDLI
ncbi:hypothetical protein N7478_002308 [Penicillium angulare]|uniref:uncharacterized protein n=1 Tax=Penicillium angulare TaxID=116970 RepID=UPI002540B7C3|nr:uncharacterized protein N7478_002308 [Penicillium angulare]KAJ5286622.1 hypothetical protein N7478_002308 [Penicillium angulare]